MEMTVNKEMVAVAEKLTPELIQGAAEPKGSIEVIADENAIQGWRVEPKRDPQEWKEGAYGKGDSFVLDFGDHLVGYLSFSVRPVGSPPDAPLKLKLVFGEMPCEIGEPFESYDGWLSSSWLQEETMFVDILPAEIKLPRRYCFRYLKVEVLDTSGKYKAAFDQFVCTTVTSGDVSKVESLPESLPEDLKLMDRIAVKTLQDCMQTVFEDGPKRDRRLWIGDLRLQAQANYYSFRNDELIKRCLYLFGGMRLEDGAVGACIFEKPHPHVDDVRFFDYSLFFVACLYDYYEAAEDRETLEKLWPVAMKQLEIGIDKLDEHGIVKLGVSNGSFIDWQSELNKETPSQGVLIYCLKRGMALAATLGLEKERAYIADQINRTTKAALDHLWENDLGVFISGADKQVSWASQVWMALAEVLPQEENAALMDRLFTQPPAIGMTTPYMFHHLIEALFLVGHRDKAIEQMRAYWGEMVQDGADTFWELYNTEDKKLSPYGSNLINSYCHAWSCTPTYFIRKYMI
ncbi:sugar hydrolase [Paenibacillus sp. LHD-38]|uniref:alpha-L-rhamnosidase-related protein n=1 Tax=Paenibacillus sp. LHD-38 TaxID=3072143 RepID=UPI00280E8CB3|nr:sugar hydrolase [Paenibacillus sp. LHD-38]MDQ8736599.1 sugar hydrolase [Paenibacillus sp. LHD-38]